MFAEYKVIENFYMVYCFIVFLYPRITTDFILSHMDTDSDNMSHH